MKIKIISMQRVLNHGSFLQAYGLMKVLQKNGADVRFEDIKSGFNNEACCQKFLRKTDVSKFNRYRMRVYEKLQEKKLLREQERYLHLSNSFASGEEVELTVIGSDEMFNCLAPSPWGITDQLFGNVPESNMVITYAVSCGHTTYEDVPRTYYPYISGALNNLEKISVRDENTYQFVRAFTQKEIQYNLDPVLIYDFEQEIQRPRIRKKYLLVYSYTNRINNREEILAIKRFAKERNLITIAAGVFQFWCDKNVPVSPFELLGYFRNATYVVTDTFHGAVISIKYNKPFAVFVRDSNSNKLSDLLNRLKRTDRMVNANSKLNDVLSADIDYEETNSIINEARINTYSYLGVEK